MPKRKKGKGKKTRKQAIAGTEEAESKSAMMQSITPIVDLMTAEAEVSQDLKERLCREIMKKSHKELEELMKSDTEVHDRIKDLGYDCSDKISPWITRLESNITRLGQSTGSVEPKPEVRRKMNEQEAKTEELKDRRNYRFNKMLVTQLEFVIERLKKTKIDASSLPPNKVDIDAEEQGKIITTTMAQRNTIIASTASQVFQNTPGMQQALIIRVNEIEKLIQAYDKKIQENLYPEDQKTAAAEEQSATADLPFGIAENRPDIAENRPATVCSNASTATKKVPQEHEEKPPEPRTSYYGPG
ncbi:hypothetical protein RLOatenuis_8370 [Rickettsiales bacterium]|nr:hypothetical protein RLOatenuis_8370 [Rickettsiales bacterium]